MKTIKTLTCSNGHKFEADKKTYRGIQEGFFLPYDLSLYRCSCCETTVSVKIAKQKDWKR